MSIDELIDKALNGNGGALEPSNLYGLVGAPETNEIFVLNLGDLFMDNFRYFVLGEDVCLILLGVYNSEQAARESVQSVRETNQLSPTGLIGSPNWYVLIADTIQNNLFNLPLNEYYIGYFGLFKYKAQALSGKVALSIFNSKEAAEECAEIIRMYIKDEAGNIL